jgi:5'(3')-deoxyribonucleotidase
MITKIFLDLDDVLNRFTVPVLAYIGCPIVDDDEFDPAWGYDIVLAANTLIPERFFTKSILWDTVDWDIWKTLPESEEMGFLLRTCRDSVGYLNTCILSGIIRCPDYLAGKLNWMQKHLPEELQRNFLLGFEKSFCACPESLLIDDNDANVQEFRDEGGQAILMPRPWNSLHNVEPFEHLFHSLSVYGLTSF